MSSMLYAALAATAFVLARPVSGRFAGVAGNWFGGSECPQDLGNPTPMTTAHATAASRTKRITPGALDGLT